MPHQTRLQTANNETETAPLHDTRNPDPRNHENRWQDRANDTRAHDAGAGENTNLGELGSSPGTMLGVFTIVERNNKSIFVRLGSAFRNRDGSLNARVDAVPTNGVFHIREVRLDAKNHDSNR